ncbi:MAG TPA: carboxypeptidase-like regulatory domain-containing protein [Balneolales bacterium]|nr:carboxypeptidase-like regulatory domain-containing protein [Balneolales bacterium]
MRRLWRIIFIMFLIAIPFSLKAQVFVKGNVIDANTGEPLVGAHVYDSDSYNGTATDMHGHFMLVLSPGNHTLVFSYIGYRIDTKLIYVVEGKGSNLEDVTLNPVIYELKSLVVEEYRSPDKLIKLARKHYYKVNSEYHTESEQFYRWITSHNENPVHLAEAVYTVNEKEKEVLWKLNEGRMVNSVKNQYLPRIFYMNLIDILRKFNLFDELLGISGPLADNWRYVYDYRIVRRSYLDTLEVYQVAFKPKKNRMDLFRGSVYIETNHFNVVGADIYIPKFRDPYVLKYDKSIIHKGDFKFDDTSVWYRFRASPIPIKGKEKKYAWLTYTSDISIITNFEARLHYTRSQMVAQNLDKSDYHIKSTLITHCHSVSFKYRFKNFELNRKNASNDSDFIDELKKTTYNPDYWRNLARFGVSEIKNQTLSYFKKDGIIKFSTN